MANRITEEQYCAIMRDKRTQKEIAKDYGIGSSSVGRYKRLVDKSKLAKKYGFTDETKPLKTTSKADCQLIYSSAMTAKKLAAHIGIALDTVYQIHCGYRQKAHYKEWVKANGKPKPLTKRNSAPVIEREIKPRPVYWIRFEQTPLNLPWGPATKPTNVPVELTV